MCVGHWVLCVGTQVRQQEIPSTDFLCKKTKLHDLVKMHIWRDRIFFIHESGSVWLWIKKPQNINFNTPKWGMLWIWPEYDYHTSSFIPCESMHESVLTNTKRFPPLLSAKTKARLYWRMWIPLAVCAGFAYPICSSKHRERSLMINSNSNIFAKDEGYGQMWLLMRKQ